MDFGFWIFDSHLIDFDFVGVCLILYTKGVQSSGKAAELTGISRIEFLERLAEFDVPVIDLTAEELEQDVKNAANWIEDEDGLPHRGQRISNR